MAAHIGINHPELLEIAYRGQVSIGGNQGWYGERWPRLSGCGPVAASNLVWYWARSREEYRQLCSAGGTREEYLPLMGEMFTYVTPSRRGVNSSALFTTGLGKYCAEHGVRLSTSCLEIPPRPRTEPMPEQLREFLTHWLGADCPVAFLNLSNGKLKRPESWHWVTIMAIEPDTMLARISDEGQYYEANLELWLATSRKGGALVALHEPVEERGG